MRRHSFARLLRDLGKPPKYARGYGPQPHPAGQGGATMGNPMHHIVTVEDLQCTICGAPATGPGSQALAARGWDGPRVCYHCWPVAYPGEEFPGAHRARVPMVADVLRVMCEQDVGQDEAVRHLGGQQ